MALVSQNFTLTDVTIDHPVLGPPLALLVSLNSRLPQRAALTQMGTPSPTWVEALVQVRDDVGALDYLLQLNPLVCRGATTRKRRTGNGAASDDSSKKLCL